MIFFSHFLDVNYTIAIHTCLKIEKEPSKCACNERERYRFVQLKFTVVLKVLHSTGVLSTTALGSYFEKGRV